MAYAPLNCTFLDLGLDCSPDFSFILIDKGAINVPISNINGSFNSLHHLARRTLKSTEKFHI